MSCCSGVTGACVGLGEALVVTGLCPAGRRTAAGHATRRRWWGVGEISTLVIPARARPSSPRARARRTRLRASRRSHPILPFDEEEARNSSRPGVGGPSEDEDPLLGGISAYKGRVLRCRSDWIPATPRSMCPLVGVHSPPVGNFLEAFELHVFLAMMVFSGMSVCAGPVGSQLNKIPDPVP
jgi:hypothetical protein